MPPHGSSLASSRLSSAGKTKRGPGPYDSKNRPNARRSVPSPSTTKADSPLSPTSMTSRSMTTPGPASARVGSSPPSVDSSLAAPVEGTRRHSYMQLIQDKYPNFEPKTDYEILTLAGSNYRGPDSGIRPWLDNQLKIDLQFGMGSDRGEEVTDPQTIARGTQAFIERATAILNMRGGLTGLKPRPETRNVFCRPIPNSPYSVRLFPGSIAQREYCLDFISTETGAPVNSPPGFEVWSTYESATPWLGGGGTIRIQSLEHTFGFSEGDIRPGAEKFVLRDGQTCLLKRPGHRDVQFKVPLRAEGLNLGRPLDVDRLDFPEVV